MNATEARLVPACAHRFRFGAVARSATVDDHADVGHKVVIVNTVQSARGLQGSTLAVVEKDGQRDVRKQRTAAAQTKTATTLTHETPAGSRCKLASREEAAPVGAPVEGVFIRGSSRKASRSDVGLHFTREGGRL